MDLYVLNGNLDVIGFVDFKSLIWIERYNRVGSCEVYAPLTDKHKKILIDGNYLCRSDDLDMVCRIRYVKITDNAENGLFITAIGTDAKYYLDSRTNRDMDVFNSFGYATQHLETLVWQVLSSNDSDRALLTPNGEYLFGFRSSSGLGGSASQSIMGLTWGEIVRQVNGSMDCGYKVHIYSAASRNLFEFICIKGTERNVWFSRTFDNIGEMAYEMDSREIGNVFYIKDTDNGINGIYVVGDPYKDANGWNIRNVKTGTERYERIIETGSQRTKTYGSIKAMVEGTWTLVQSGNDVIIHA